MQAFKSVLRKIKDADDFYGLIENGDKIAVGVSGGKDSMLMVLALYRYRQYTKKDFEIVAINAALGWPDMDFTHAKKFIEDLGVQFISVPTDVAEILKLNLDNKGQIQCSICSKMKKAVVIKEAKEQGCNKFAFAHHADDAVETFMLNSIYTGRIGTFAAKSYFDQSDITFIRPFILVDESEIKASVKNQEVPIVPSTCPNDKHTKREEMKDLFAELCQRYPMMRNNYIRMLKGDYEIEMMK